MEKLTAEELEEWRFAFMQSKRPDIVEAADNYDDMFFNRVDERMYLTGKRLPTDKDIITPPDFELRHLKQKIRQIRRDLREKIPPLINGRFHHDKDVWERKFVFVKRMVNELGQLIRERKKAYSERKPENGFFMKDIDKAVSVMDADYDMFRKDFDTYHRMMRKAKWEKVPESWQYRQGIMKYLKQE